MLILIGCFAIALVSYMVGAAFSVMEFSRKLEMRAYEKLSRKDFEQFKALIKKMQ